MRGLPPASALTREVTGADWTDDTYLLATIADRLGIVAAPKYGLKTVPDAVPRPKQPRAAAPVARDAATIAGFFGGGGS